MNLVQYNVSKIPFIVYTRNVHTLTVYVLEMLLLQLIKPNQQEVQLFFERLKRLRLKAAMQVSTRSRGTEIGFMNTNLL